MTDPVGAPSPHYATGAARRADLLVHLIGLVLALFGGGYLVASAVAWTSPAMIASVWVYVLGSVTMLTCSAAYNFARPSRRPLLRRLDHAGIFVMIAGSYTPLFTHALSGTWAWAMTSVVWAIASVGVIAKLFLPGMARGFWVGIYLLLGWVGIAAAKPMGQSLERPVIVLIAIGGLLYTSGVAFYVNKKLVYSRAIWHGHVVAAAVAHWTAMLLCVTLESPA